MLVKRYNCLIYISCTGVLKIQVVEPLVQRKPWGGNDDNNHNNNKTGDKAWAWNSGYDDFPKGLFPLGISQFTDLLKELVKELSP